MPTHPASSPFSSGAYLALCRRVESLACSFQLNTVQIATTNYPGTNVRRVLWLCKLWGRSHLPQNAIYDHVSFGPSFGSGDFRLNSDMRSGSSSPSSFNTFQFSSSWLGMCLSCNGLLLTSSVSLAYKRKLTLPTISPIHSRRPQRLVLEPDRGVPEDLSLPGTFPLNPKCTFRMLSCSSKILHVVLPGVWFDALPRASWSTRCLLSSPLWSWLFLVWLLPPSTTASSPTSPTRSRKPTARRPAPWRAACSVPLRVCYIHDFSG